MGELRSLAFLWDRGDVHGWSVLGGMEGGGGWVG